MICLDNSEFMRNGDFIPSRMEAIQDAANLVSTSKIQSNPENTVGVMALAGKGPELLVSPTEDVGKIMASLHDVKLFGTLSFVDGVQVAGLSLKHRRNKNGGQRIVVFVGSPVVDEPKALSRVGKQLKKNGIAVDVISVGEGEENQAKLEEFVNAVNNSNNSHLVTVPAGCVPSDILITSPVVNEAAAAGDMGGPTDMGGVAPAGADGAAAAGDFGGVDPSMDPELAMALRVSMEEERARQEREAKTAGDETPGPTVPTISEEPPAAMEVDDAGPAPAAPAPATTPAPNTPAPVTTGPAPLTDEEVDLEEQELLQQALAMSMQDAVEEGGEADAAPMETEGSTDAELQMALQMSMQPTPAGAGAAATPAAASDAASAPAAAGDAAAAGQFIDPSFVNSMLESLPGVDPSDPMIQQALQQIQAKQQEDQKDGSGEKK